MAKISELIQLGLCWLIRAYRLLISPFLGARCCYYPSCSRYAEQAICQHGVFKGVYLTSLRLARCYPGRGGVDEVPRTFSGDDR